MNNFATLLIHIYYNLLLFYPRRFCDEFAEEMQVVFRDSVDEAVKDGRLSVTFICLRELVGLPSNIMREIWHELRRKETVMHTSEETLSESNTDELKDPQGALIGTLPFVLFGVAAMIDKLRLPFHAGYVYLVFYILILIGLLVGMIKHVPRWTYSYLGWSLVFAWWDPIVSTYGLKIFGFQIIKWSWLVWPPLLVTIGIALLWARSLNPIRWLIRGIWQSWTSLSLMMYTFASFAQLIYDENHHPYLFAFIHGSMFVISAGAWMFLQSTNPRKQVASLLFGFIAASIIGSISYATWDWQTYYGLPKGLPQAWYVSAIKSIVIYAFWSAILFWPALVGVVRRATNNQKIA